MALMTVTEVKSILRISDSTYDADIDFFLPLVEEDIIDYIDHAFQDSYIYKSGGSIFNLQPDTSSGDYITNSDSDFTVKGFAGGMDIYINGGHSNEGLYTIASAADSQLTLEDKGVLVSQDQGNTANDNYIGDILISRVVWPKALKLIAAKMIWYLIDKSKPSDVASESIDDYSVSYAGSNAYPNRIISMLDKYRRPAFL